MRKIIFLRVLFLIVLSFLLVNYANFSFSMDRSQSRSIRLKLVKMNDQNFRLGSKFISQGFKEYDIEAKGCKGDWGFPGLNIDVEHCRPIIRFVGGNLWNGLSIGHMFIHSKAQKHCSFLVGEPQDCLLSYIFNYKREHKCSFVTVRTFCEAQKNFFESIGFDLEFIRKGYEQDKVCYYLRCDHDTHNGSGQLFVGELQNESNQKEAFKIGYILKDGSLMVGVIEARVCLGCVHILNIFIKKEYRRKGFGKQLIEKVLEEGKRYKCSFAILETFNYMAPGFYKKLGFEVDFIRKGYAFDIEQSFMSKKL